MRRDEVRRRIRERRRRGGGGSLLPGLLITVLGLVILLDNLDVVDSSQIFRFWPAILVFVGVRSLYGARDRGTATTGTLLAAAGGLLLLDSFGVLEFSIFSLWPLFLVMFGLHMMMRSLAVLPPPAEAADSSETSFAFLGGVERRNRSAHFTGGSATAFMGGVELDLSEAEMSGDAAVFSVLAMMGGIEIRIPESWTLENKVTPILGGVEDKTRSPADGSKRFVLQGMAFMGGVEVKN